ncbi:FliG C-terminal domain-containing protein [Roseivivax sp. CAU 1761]
MSVTSPLAALPAPAAAAGRARLSRRDKAAIVVQFIVNEGAEVPLASLPDPLQERLTQALGGLRYVDRSTLDAVLTEFSEELAEIGLRFPDGVAGALDMLDGRLAAQTARRLRKAAGVRQAGDPWQRIGAQSVERLLQFVDAESCEISAVILSKIEVAKAAQILERLPGPQARRITFAVSRTAGITPDAVDRIGLSLSAQLDADPDRAFAAAPVERIGAILNQSPDALRDDVLSGLAESDAGFATLVRRAIFTFANIPERLAPEDVPRVIREVNNGTMVTALAGAAGGELAPVAEFLLSGLSKRAAAALSEEVAERAMPATKEAEAAQRAVVSAIRDIAGRGEIVLLTMEDQE